MSRRRSIVGVTELDAVQEFALGVGPHNAVWAGCDPDDDGFWQSAWSLHSERLLSQWIGRHPGSRPWAWWRFDSPALRGDEDELDDQDAEELDDQDDEEIDDQDDEDEEDEDEEDEEEAALLYRLGLIGPDEMEGIRARARKLVAYNLGRRPDRPRDNFIPPGGAEQLAIDLGLLSSEEAAILNDSPSFSIAESRGHVHNNA
jgi:hypothetical protein